MHTALTEQGPGCFLATVCDLLHTDHGMQQVKAMLNLQDAALKTSSTAFPGFKMRDKNSSADDKGMIAQPNSVW